MMETFRPFGVLHVYSSIMLKWVLTILIGLVILAAVAPRLRLPGDFRFAIKGRSYYVPLASTLVLSLIVWLLSRVF
jgi:hypothetical protein